MNFQALKAFIILTLFLTTEIWGLSGTNGTPIGGMGTGYVLYNAVTGDFAASQKIPPAASDGILEFANKRSRSSGFHFFVDGTYLWKARTKSEDAKCPLYTANYGKVPNTNVSFTLNAFGPYVSGDNNLNFQLITSPLAFFEITAKNEGSKTADVAVALEFSNVSNGKNLLGGSNDGKNDPASNNRGITFSGTSAEGNAYMLVDCDNKNASFSAGAMGTFSTNGVLTNGSGNLIAAKCNIPAGETVRFKFTMAWWRTFISTVDRYGTGKPDSENYYYHNFYDNSKSAAEFGNAHFDLVSNGVKSMVSRVVESNFPEWYKDRLLNNLYPLIHNSQCAKDGRMAFWEGHYAIIGTLDQGEHASLWYTFNWPKNQWQELQYWIRTAHTGVGEDKELKGQIHHDFNTGPAQWTLEAHFMAPWDDYLHKDYWWSQNTTNWSDLNTMLIFKAYELMLATGNLDSMKIYFPKILNTADRLLYMCAQANSHLPILSKSTYDQSSVITPQYASGIALTAFLAIEQMAKFVGDTVTAKKYRDWYTIARKEYKDKQYTATYASGREFCEGDVAGYSWAHYLGLEPIMDDDFISEACKRLWRYYSIKASNRDKLGQWHFYTYDHFGGAEIAIGKPDTGMIVHKWDYDYYYTAKPATVFWQDLQKTNTAYASYMTAPCVWRSYFQMTGYLLDNANKRLWIRPSIPSSMNKKITNAPLPNPNGWGTLNYDENTKDKQTQSITVSFDSLVTVKEIVLKNNTGVDKPFIRIIDNKSGQMIINKTFVTEGSGLVKNIRITLDSSMQIGKSGIYIGAYSGEVGVNRKMSRHGFAHQSILDNVIAAGRQIHYSVDVNGPVSMELLSLNGKVLGVIMQKSVSAGENSFIWNGRTTNGSPIKSSLLILRLKSQSGVVSKKVLTY
jgi:uncharacterized protein (DUF608 family)